MAAKRKFMIDMVAIKFKIKFMKFGKDIAKRVTSSAKKTLSFCGNAFKREA